MQNLSIDINSDLGESFGRYQLGDTEKILDIVSSANLACGCHAGDPMVMHKTVALCVDKQVAIGAHVGYPDLQGFGRRKMDLSFEEIYNYTLYQLGALDAFTRVCRTKICHINGHGALGNLSHKDEQVAHAIVKAAHDFDPSLIIIASRESSQMNRFAKEYVKSIIHEEVKKIDDVERNPLKMQNVLRSLARNISTQVSNSTIEEDVKNNFEDISRPTLNDYLNTLEKLFVIEDVNATNLNFRSKYALRTKPKKYFVDPSIATAILDIKPNDLINDLNTFGFIFESLCIRDLKIYTQSYDSNITFYRDEKDFEVDAIVRTNSGKWGAIEIKLGAGYIDEAAKNLLKFKERVDIEKCGEPAFLMVLTGANYSYKRPDGVYVVSIGTLKN